MARRRESGFIMRQSRAGLFRVCNRVKGDLLASNRRRPVVIAPKQALATSNAFDRRIFMRFAIALMRSEEHTSELQSLMRISYAVFCLKKKNKKNYNLPTIPTHNR